jgi:hypothetical protein
MTQDERNKLILDYETTHGLWMKGIKENSLSSAQNDEFKRECRRLKALYVAGLPRLEISRCPHTSAPLVQAIDPWGVDGYWWQEGEGAQPKPVALPPTFAVLTGALNLRGRPPLGGPREDAHVGPDAPFVIPRILSMPSMIAVISCLTLSCGYKAYPIAYFATTRPSPGLLTQSWTLTSYNWVDDDGTPSFSYPTDPWDFELGPWIDRGKVQWIETDDKTLKLHNSASGRCPYVDLPAKRLRQIIYADKIRHEPPPNGEEINPFGD